MKRLIFALVFVLCIGLPIASAQDTPTAEFPTETAVVVETATPFETATALPTETATPEPSATPVPEPEPPAPPATDWNLLIPWIGAAGLVFAIGLFIVLRTALVQLGKSVPLPAWEIGKGTTKTVYEQLMQLFGRTPNTIDDFLGGEAGKMLEDYFKEVDRLRAEVGVLKSQVAQTAQIVQGHDFRGDITRPPTTPE